MNLQVSATVPQSSQEGPGCRALRQNAEAGRAGLRWFNNDNWDNVRLLTAYRDEYQSNVDGLAWLDRIETAVGVTGATIADGYYASKFLSLSPEAAAGRASLVGFTALAILNNG